MVCCEEVTIQTINEMNPGDHIATQGHAIFFGNFYDHHAIVTEVKKENDNEAEINVVDVARKDMECTCSCRRSTCCFCCCIKFKYPIEEHKLFNKSWKLPAPGVLAFLAGLCCIFKNNDIMTQNIRRISYRKRRNDLASTKDMALGFVGKQNNLAYCIIGQNCEHFASACVNGRNPMSYDDLKKSMSIQSRNFCWRMMHVLFMLLQGTFYGLNFCIYAVFVAKDESFDFFLRYHRKKFERLCYQPDNDVRGFDTTCDWLTVPIFIVIFIIVFTIALLAFYKPLYKKSYICKQCWKIARIDCFSKILTFVIIEVVSIYLENPSYKRITQWHAGKWVFAVVGGISVFGAFLVYSVSSLITWLIGMCFLSVKTCEEVGTFTKYFKFRGFVRPFVRLVRRFRRTKTNTKTAHVA